MKYLFLSLFLLAASLGVLAAPQDTRPPLTKDELHDLLISKTPSKVVVATIEQCGIAFKPTDDVLEEFRKAGADKAVLAALRQAWHAEIPKPLTNKEIRMMLAEDVSSENIAAAVLERGIDFKPTDDYLDEIRSDGAKGVLIDTLQAAVPRPFSKDELLQLLASRMEQDWIAQQVEQRGIDFEPGKENLQALQTRGARAALLEAIRTAKRAKPFVAHFPPPPKVSSPLVHEKPVVLICDPSDKDVPVFSDPHDIGVVVDRLRCGDHVIFLEKITAPPGFDKVHYAVGKDGYVADSYLESPIATPGPGVTAPIPSYKPEPAYTPEARSAGIQGKVTLAIVVDAQGNVIDVQETSEILGGGLDKIAMDTVKTWRFTPATRNGIPVPVRVSVVVSFRLYQNTP